jgi:hypothetical protein
VAREHVRLLQPVDDPSDRAGTRLTGQARSPVGQLRRALAALTHTALDHAIPTPPAASVQIRSGVIGSASQARAAHYRCRGMGGAHRHPGAEHGQEGELAWSALERAGQPERFQAQHRPNATLDAVNNLPCPVLM